MFPQSSRGGALGSLPCHPALPDPFPGKPSPFSPLRAMVSEAASEDLGRVREDIRHSPTTAWRLGVGWGNRDRKTQRKEDRKTARARDPERGRNKAEMQRETQTR